MPRSKNTRVWEIPELKREDAAHVTLTSATTTYQAGTPNKTEQEEIVIASIPTVIPYLSYRLTTDKNYKSDLKALVGRLEVNCHLIISF